MDTREVQFVIDLADSINDALWRYGAMWGADDVSTDTYTDAYRVTTETSNWLWLEEPEYGCPFVDSNIEALRDTCRDEEGDYISEPLASYQLEIELGHTYLNVTLRLSCDLVDAPTAPIYKGMFDRGKIILNERTIDNIVRYIEAAISMYDGTGTTYNTLINIS